MDHNTKNICRTVISGKEQNLKKQTVEYRISILWAILYVHLGQIQYFFKVLKTDFTMQSSQYCVGTLYKYSITELLFNWKLLIKK